MKRDMRLEHIALTIKDSKEINDFYCNVLGMNRTRDFILKRDVADVLFGIDSDVEVSFLEKDGITFEVFTSESLNARPVDHICISVLDREVLVEKAEQKGYAFIRIKRPEFDLVFIKDKSGNLFELRSNA